MEFFTATNKKKPINFKKLDRVTKAKLGQKLRAMYDEVVSQGVPNRFVVLLEPLAGHANKGGH